MLLGNIVIPPPSPPTQKSNSCNIHLDLRPRWILFLELGIFELTSSNITKAIKSDNIKDPTFSFEIGSVRFKNFKYANM